MNDPLGDGKMVNQSWISRIAMTILAAGFLEAGNE